MSLRTGAERAWARPSTELAPDRSRAFERLKKEWPKLVGRWVALSEDDVIASANTLKELLAFIQPIELAFPALVHFVE